MLAYDFTVLEDPTETIDTLLGAATIDLNDNGQAELLMPINHALHGSVPRASVVVARLTPDGWRFAGVIVVPESYPGGPDVFVEEKSYAGWRIINNGSRWNYERLNGEVDLMGGNRYCWTETPQYPFGEPDLFDGWGIPYDKGGPGYFNEVAIDQPCLE